MSNAIVSNVYRYVIDDVINQVRGDFEDMGIDDAILQELQRSWESKVARSRVANFGFKDGEYYNEETGNTAEAAPSGATQAAGPNSNTVPVSNNTARNLSTNTDPSSALQYPSEYGQQPAAASLANLATAASRQQQQFQNNNTLPPPQQQQQRMIPDPSTLVNQYQQMQQQQQQQQMQPNLPELQLPGSRPNNLPQNDGSNDSELTSTEQIDQHIHDIILQSSQPEEQCEISFTASSFSGEPLALDSLPDSVKQLMKDAKSRALLKKKNKSKRISQLDGGEGEDNSDDGEGTTPGATTTTTTATGAAAGDNDDINSDLDDTDEDDDDGEGGEEIEHIILCLYDKVTRTKNKWKCILKDGIMLVNGRDYLFHRANGDFEW